MKFQALNFCQTNAQFNAWIHDILENSWLGPTDVETVETVGSGDRLTPSQGNGFLRNTAAYKVEEQG